MPVKMSDLVDGSNDSTSNNNGGASSNESSRDELERLCEEIGGDFDHAMLYVDHNGQKDALIDYAKWWRDASDEERQLVCQYRAAAGENRIRKGWLYQYENDHDASFSAWSQSFYGDSDAPSEGTYNDLQQRVRNETDGNLMFHQAIFPVPREEYWPSGEAVLWHEYPSEKIGYGDDKRDTHVFVDRAFIDEYRDYTFTADGETKVRPPTDAEINRAAGGHGDVDASQDGESMDRALPFNPSDFTVDELRDELDPVTDFTVEGLEAVLEEEKRGNGRFNNRKNAKRAIRGALQELRDAQSDSESDDSAEGQQSLDDATSADGSTSDTSDDSNGETVGEIAGRIFAEHQPDTAPDVIKGMLKTGMSEEEVVAVVTE